MDKPDSCVGCGVCCFLKNGPDLDVEVNLRESKGVPPDLREFRPGGVRNKFSCWMRRNPDTSCKALDPVTRFCTIYDTRPGDCWSFSRDSKECSRLFGL